MAVRDILVDNELTLHCKDLEMSGDLTMGDTLTLNNGTENVSQVCSAAGDLTVNASGDDINFHSTDKVHVLNTTVSNSVSSGALVITGGAGIGKRVYVGDSVNVTGDSAVNSYYGTFLGDHSASTFSHLVLGVDPSTCNSAVFKYDHAGGTASTSNFLDVGVYGATTTGGLRCHGDGHVTAPSAIDSTVVTDGGLVISGGVGIAKKLNVGDDVTLFDGTDSVKLSVAGGDLTIDASGNDINFHSSDAVHVLNNTASTSSTTGALLVVGGVGIGGGLNVAGAFNAVDASAQLYGLSINNDLAVLGGFTAVNASATIYGLGLTDVTDSSSSTTGCLRVAGGLGVVKSVNVGGNVAATGTVTGSNIGSYLTYTGSDTTSGAFAVGFNYVVSKVGNMVTLSWRDCISAGSANSTLDCLPVNQLPSEYRPSYNKEYLIQIIDDPAAAGPGIRTIGAMRVYANGTILVGATEQILGFVGTAGEDRGMIGSSVTWIIE